MAHLLFASGPVSKDAARVDALWLFWLMVAGFFTLLICILLLVFCIRYRRRKGQAKPRPVHGNIPLEVVWIVIPLVLAMVLFGWGAVLYRDLSQPPGGTLDVYVVAKQWMWKVQHPSGRREINELHLPAGRPVRLILSSEDVIHDFFVPAFRVKMDVLPGRFTYLGLEPERTGVFDLFCAEFCGTGHSDMIGKVVVLEPHRFQQWLDEDPERPPMAESGKQLFERLGCAACHMAGDDPRGPTLRGLYGSMVRLESGASVLADEAYLREAVLEPDKTIVRGYRAIMPTYKDQVTEEQLVKLLEYMRSLEDAQPEKDG